MEDQDEAPDERGHQGEDQVGGAADHEDPDDGLGFVRAIREGVTGHVAEV